MKKTSVAVIMGSKSDWQTMTHCVDALRSFGIEPKVHVMSAHRTPDEAAEFAKNAKKNGLKIIIAAAGMAAHLGGVLAAHTTLPVIGVPMKGGAMDGLDALLATVQMPGGVPVATVALGRSGAVNAAILAVQMLALSDSGLAAKIKRFKQNQQKKVKKADKELQRELTGE